MFNTRGEMQWDVPIVGHPALMALPVKPLLNKPEYWSNAFGAGYLTTTYDEQGKLPQRTTELMEKLRRRAISAAVVLSVISNVVFDATGVRLRSVPYTPDKVKLAIAAQRKGSQPYELISTTILPTARRELMASKASRNRSNGNPIAGGGSTARVWSHKAISFLKRS